MPNFNSRNQREMTGSNASPFIRIRKAEERGQADHGWLKSAHSFSFANYNDPEHVHFESLRVINDDHVAAGMGFPSHPHQDFEIFSYVLSGALEHKDSMGNGSCVKAGGVQYMSAGSGVTHSEFNPSAVEPAHFLQVWLIPNRRGGAPRYETLSIKPEEKRGQLKLFLSGKGDVGAIRVRQDADVYAAELDGRESLSFTLRPSRRAWVQMARGSLLLNGKSLAQGDGAAIETAGELNFSNGRNAEFLLFDLAALD